MATCSDIQLYDIGTVFEITVKDCGTIVDLTNLSSAEFELKPPVGNNKVVTASVKAPATDGVLYYVTVTDDLDVVGSWQLQAKCTFPTGVWRSSIIKFKVKDNL